MTLGPNHRPVVHFQAQRLWAGGNHLRQWVPSQNVMATCSCVSLVYLRRTTNWHVPLPSIVLSVVSAPLAIDHALRCNVM